MRLAKFAKTPGDRKRYEVHYDDWLDEGETLYNVETGIDQSIPGGIYVDGLLIGPDQTSVILFVSEGEPGLEYNVGIKVTTSNSQIKEDYLTFVVRDVPDLVWGE